MIPPRETFKIPEEFKDRPEWYFVKLEHENQEKEIKRLYEKLEQERECRRRYELALHEIRSIIEICRRRVDPIREVLDKAEIFISEID